MIDILLTILRDKTTSRHSFRDAVDRVSLFLAMETARHLPRNEVRIESPICETDGVEFSQKIVIIPILRAGLSMLPGFMRVFNESSLGFIGIRRNEKTALPYQYYNNLPVFTGDEQVIVVDPTIATGGSALTAMRLCVERGVPKEQLTLVNIFAAPEGLEEVRKEFAESALVTGTIDDGLNTHKYIVPGVGDFGDRFCGTE